MNSYRYSAFSGGGDLVAGTIEARSRADALRLIHDRGMLAFEAVEVLPASARGGGRLLTLLARQLGLARRVSFARDLSTLLNAEVAIDQSLRILSEAAAKGVMRRIVYDCAERVAAGHRLSEALKANGSGFREDELAMIAAGEQNGTLASVLDQLASLLERRLELGHRLASALIYPALLVVMAIVSIFVILTVLVPNIQPLFEGSEAKLPAAVSALLALEAMLTEHGVVILAALLAILVGSVFALRQPGPSRLVDAAMLRLPLVGGLLRKSILARICRTLATLLVSGVPLQQALGATIDVARNASARRVMEEVREHVVTGGKLSQSIAGKRLFDDASLRLIQLGEETNRLQQMLLHVAATTEAHVVRQIERAMTLLTPVLTLGLGLMIGGLIMSVMQAILGINEIAVR